MMKVSQTDKHVFSLLSSAGLDSRKQRQLRRSLASLGATVDASKDDRWNPKTTHLIANAPVPCVKWVCAIAAAARVLVLKPSFLDACIAANDINVDTATHELEFNLHESALLPAEMDTLWAGRVWPASFEFWRQHAQAGKGDGPLNGHRVLVLGQLKPRGAAGMAAPSNKIVTDLLISSGARVVSSLDDDPTFAIAAPGLDPARLPELKKALRNQVLCLGSAFMVDLICRVSANPSHYVMFEEQRSFCGPPLDRTSCMNAAGRLPVSTKNHSETNKPQPRRSLRHRARKQKEGECTSSPSNSIDGVSIVSTDPPSKARRDMQRSTPEATSEVKSTADVGINANTFSSVTPLSKTTPCTPAFKEVSEVEDIESPVVKRTRSGRPRRTRKRPRICTSDVRSALQFESPKKIKMVLACSRQPDTDKVTCGDSKTVEANDAGKRACSISVPKSTHMASTGVCSGQPPTFAESPAREGQNHRLDEVHEKQAEGVLSRSPQASSPKARSGVIEGESHTPTRCSYDKGVERSSETPDGKRKEDHFQGTHDTTSSPTHGKGGPSALPKTEKPNNDGDMPGEYQTFRKSTPIRGTAGVIDVDTISEPDALSELSRKTTRFSSPLLQSKAIRTIEDGYNFVLGILGGKPSKRDVDWIPKAERSQSTEEVSQQTCSDASDVLHSRILRTGAEESPAFEIDEPLWYDDTDILGQGTQIVRPAFVNTSRGPARDRLGQDRSSGHTHRNRREIGRENEVDIFSMRVPRNLVVLRNVLQPKFAAIQNANDLRISSGISADDETCQNEVKYVDWIMGAERLIGCSPTEGDEGDASTRASTARRMCLSLVESGSLSRFKSAGGLSEVEILVLTGICTRLVITEAGFDSCPSLVGELLSLRERQTQAGFDSLEKVLSSPDSSSVSIRHRAVATMWSILILRASQSIEMNRLWSIFNNACNLRLREQFSNATGQSAGNVGLLRKGLNWILSSSLIVSYAHAIQLDFIRDSRTISDVSSNAAIPENWDLICTTLDYFSGEVGTSLGPRKGTSDILFMYLRNVAVKVAHRAWKVSEKALQAVSKAIAYQSKFEHDNCYCKVPALFVSKFQRLFTEGSLAAGNVEENLRTPCDCYFLLGWRFAAHGEGNAMKRAMGVIKYGSILTNISLSSPGYSRAVNHHVALTLTVADNLASTGANGEYLLCRTLTSKCPRIEAVMDRYSTHGKEDDQCWKATVDSIGVRCHALHAKGGSFHVYSNWLAQSVVASFHKVRKSSKGRGSVPVRRREELRVQESVFVNLALLTLSSLRDVTDLLISKAIEGDANTQESARLYAEKSEVNIGSFARVANDLVSRMRSNAEESVNKSKVLLLSALLAVIGNETWLIAHVNGGKANINADGKHVDMAAAVKRRSEIFEKSELESTLVSILGNDICDEEYEMVVKLKCRAARTLAQLMEVKLRRGHGEQSVDERRKTEEVLRHGRLQLSVHEKEYENSEYRSGDERRVLRKRVENRARVEFWSEVFAGQWGKWFIETSETRIQDILMGVLAAGIAYLSVEEDSEYCMKVRGLVGSVGQRREYERVMEEWGSRVYNLGSKKFEIEEDGVRAGEWAIAGSVECVTDMVSNAATIGKVGVAQEMVKGLRELARGWIRQSKKMRSVQDGLCIYCHMLCVWAQVQGMSRLMWDSQWLPDWVEPIREGVQRLQSRQWRGESTEMGETLCWLQERVIGALGMVEPNGRDLERRVCVTRLVKSFAQGSGTLGGFWRRGRVEVGERSGWGCVEERRRFGRNVREWQKTVFHIAVDEGLRSGGGAGSEAEVAVAVGRLTEAVEHFRRDEARCAVLLWQARQVYARAMGGELARRVSAGGRLAAQWRAVERLITSRP